MYIGTLSAVVLGGASTIGDVVGALTVAYDLLTGALFVPALVSMVVSSVVVVALMATRGLFSNDPIIYGMLTSLVVFVVVSLLTPRPSEEHMRAWERRLGGTA